MKLSALLISVIMLVAIAAASTPSRYVGFEDFVQQNIIPGNYLASQIGANVSPVMLRVSIPTSTQDNALYTQLNANGFPLLGSLGGDNMGTFFQGAGNACTSNCNWTFAQWNASIVNATKNYPYIHYWEIWNEPQDFFAGPISEYDYNNNIPALAANYLIMTKDAYNIIHAHNSSDQIVCFGGLSLTGADSLSGPQYTFANDLWKDGEASYCNEISLHAYTDNQYLLTQVPPGQSDTYEAEWAHALGAYENLTHLPVWITETGMPSNNWTGEVKNNSPAKQAQELNLSFSFLFSHSYVKAIFWFDLWSPSSETFNYGLFNSTTYAPKPAFSTFKTFLYPAGSTSSSSSSTSSSSSSTSSSSSVSTASTGGSGGVGSTTAVTTPPTSISGTTTSSNSTTLKTSSISTISTLTTSVATTTANATTGQSAAQQSSSNTEMWIGVGIVIIIILAALIWVLMHRRRSTPPEPEIPPPPPPSLSDTPPTEPGMSDQSGMPGQQDNPKSPYN